MPSLFTMPATQQRLWLAVLLILAVTALWLLRWEWQQYRRRGLGRSALILRLVSLPILLLTALAIWLPASMAAGWGGLVLLYAGLVLLGPLLWFGLHMWVGACCQPSLDRGVSCAIAGSGLLLILSVSYLLHALQTPLWRLSRWLAG